MIHSGDFLIALPSDATTDLIFSKSVILITEIEQKSIMGFICNKPLDLDLHTLVSNIDSNFTVYHGGPVEQDKIFFIHNKPNLIPNSMAINDHLFLGGDFDIIIHLLNTHQLNKEDIRFFLGYTGWSPDQLDKELEDQFWIHLKAPIINQNLLALSADTVWKKIMDTLGASFAIWKNAPENPEFN